MFESRIIDLHQKAHRAAFAWYIRKGTIPPVLTEILEATRSVEAFVKYNPDWMNQPRAPSGQPEGGQWTGDGSEGSGSGQGGHEEDDAGNNRDRNSLAGQIGYILQNLFGIPAAHAQMPGTPIRKPWIKEDPGTVPAFLNDGRPVTYQGETVYGQNGKILVAHGATLLMPKGISLSDNATIGEKLSYMPSIFTPGIKFPAPIQGINSIPLREIAMIALLAPGQPMDYQRIYSGTGRISQIYIDIGNYNFGVVTAAAGYERDQAQLAAAIVNVATYPKGSLDKLFRYISTPDPKTGQRPGTSEIWDFIFRRGYVLDPDRLTGPMHGNPRNIPWIDQGFSDYNRGLIKAPGN